MTLTEAGYWTKKGGIIFLLFAGFVIVVWQVSALLNPEPKIPKKYIIANKQCSEDELPPITLPKKSLKVNWDNVELETETGDYPDLPRIVNVYEYDYKGGTLGAREISQDIANTFGFDPEGIRKKSNNEFIFLDRDNDKNLIVESTNQNVYFEQDVNISEGLELESEEEVKDINGKVYTSNDLDIKDYDLDLTLIRYLVETNDGFNETGARVGSDVARADLFRMRQLIAVEEKYIDSKELGDYLRKVLPESPQQKIENDEGKKIKVRTYSVHVVPQKPYESNVFSIFKGKQVNQPNGEDLIQINYTNWPIGDTPCGTYELIGEEQAIENMKTGNAYMAYINTKGANTLTPPPGDLEVNSLRVFDISISYLDTIEVQEFLQPVYVIEGEANTNKGIAEFIIYVPAVKNVDLVFEE
jgi:hypothetical protein